MNNHRSNDNDNEHQNQQSLLHKEKALIRHHDIISFRDKLNSRSYRFEYANGIDDENGNGSKNENEIGDKEEAMVLDQPMPTQNLIIGNGTTTNEENIDPIVIRKMSLEITLLRRGRSSTNNCCSYTPCFEDRSSLFSPNSADKTMDFSNVIKRKIDNVYDDDDGDDNVVNNDDINGDSPYDTNIGSSQSDEGKESPVYYTEENENGECIRNVNDYILGEVINDEDDNLPSKNLFFDVNKNNDVETEIEMSMIQGCTENNLFRHGHDDDMNMESIDIGSNDDCINSNCISIPYKDKSNIVKTSVEEVNLETSPTLVNHVKNNENDVHNCIRQIGNEENSSHICEEVENIQDRFIGGMHDDGICGINIDNGNYNIRKKGDLGNDRNDVSALGLECGEKKELCMENTSNQIDLLNILDKSFHESSIAYIVEEQKANGDMCIVKEQRPSEVPCIVGGLAQTIAVCNKEQIIPEEGYITTIQKQAEEKGVEEEQLCTKRDARLAEKQFISKQQQNSATERRITEDVNCTEDQKIIEQRHITENQGQTKQTRIAEKDKLADKASIVEEQILTKEACIEKESYLTGNFPTKEELILVNEAQLKEGKSLAETCQRKSAEITVVDNSHSSHKLCLTNHMHAVEKNERTEADRVTGEVSITDECTLAEEVQSAGEQRQTDEDEILEEQRPAEEPQLDQEQKYVDETKATMTDKLQLYEEVPIKGKSDKDQSIVSTPYEEQQISDKEISTDQRSRSPDTTRNNRKDCEFCPNKTIDENLRVDEVIKSSIAEKSPFSQSHKEIEIDVVQAEDTDSLTKENDMQVNQKGCELKASCIVTNVSCDLISMKVNELRAICSDHGLKSTGLRKAQLISMLESHYDVQNELGLEHDDVSQSDLVASKNSSDFRSMKVVQLRAECDQRNLPEGGLKVALIERLENFSNSENIISEELYPAITSQSVGNSNEDCNFRSMKVVQLRAECKKRDLSQGGLKATLVKRLENFAE